MYSFKYGYMRLVTGGPDPGPERPESGETDFVVVHPSLGYLVLEVKQGKIGYGDGRWYEEKQGGQQPLGKDPVQQPKALRTSSSSAGRKHDQRKVPVRLGDRVETGGRTHLEISLDISVKVPTEIPDSGGELQDAEAQKP